MESRQADMSKEEAFEIVAWQIRGETLPSLKGSWQDCPKAGMEAAGDRVSCVVTQCFLVKIKGCEVKVVGNQGRDNTITTHGTHLLSVKEVSRAHYPESSWHPHGVLTQSNRGRLVILFQFYI